MQTRRGQLGMDGVPLRAPMRARSYGPGAHCAVPGCINHAKRLMLGMCSTHYQAHRAGHLDVDTATTGHVQTGAPGPCIVNDCEERARNRDMCLKHAAQRDAGILDTEGNKLRELLHGGRTPIDGPIINQHGYVLVRPAEGYQGKTQYGRVLEHRYNMELHLGRLLFSRGHPLYEIVHHKDRNRQNNALDNLELVAGNAETIDGSEDFEEELSSHHPGHSITELEFLRCGDHLRLSDRASFLRVMQHLAQFM